MIFMPNASSDLFKSAKVVTPLYIAAPTAYSIHGSVSPSLYAHLYLWSRGLDERYTDEYFSS